MITLDGHAIPLPKNYTATLMKQAFQQSVIAPLTSSEPFPMGVETVIPQYDGGIEAGFVEEGAANLRGRHVVQDAAYPQARHHRRGLLELLRAPIAPPSSMATSSPLPTTGRSVSPTGTRATTRSVIAPLWNRQGVPGCHWAPHRQQCELVVSPDPSARLAEAPLSLDQG